MAVPRFHVPTQLAALAADREIALPEAVAHHATRVVRLSAGDALVLFDGSGGEYHATLTRVDKRGAHASIVRFEAAERESPLDLTLAQSVVASDAMDHVIRKAVELGVRTICPVISARSAPLPGGPRADKRRQHWQQVIVAACEQCGRNRLPTLAPVQTLAEWLAAGTAPGIVCVPDAASTWRGVARPDGALAVAIGPEGGWTPGEIDDFRGRGFALLGLGPRVLRAQTAAVAALAVAQTLFGDAG